MRRIFALLLVLAMLCLSGCGKPVTAQGFAMDTVVSLTLYGASEADAENVLALCEAYEALFSRTQADSDLSRLAAGEAFAPSAHTLRLVALARHWAEVTDGAFDPALGAVTELWDFTSGAGTVPPETEIHAALAQSGWENIALSDTAITLAPGAKLDLGGIAKGYIADRMGEALREEGIESGLVNLGGDVLCIGEKPDGSGFAIGIQDPFGDTGEPILILHVRDAAVVTSGNYQRYFEQDGVRYHHILNPETGYPVQSGLASVTVITASAADADAIATACMVLGLEQGMALVESLEGVWAVFITESQDIFYSAETQARFS